ncbi:MAG: hypothetical protein Q4C22_01915 [Bacillota bacterium]|nr:hypothetical protein [Bacillota bacterium]
MKTSMYIGDNAIEAVTGKDTGKKLKIRGYWRMPIEAGLVEHGVIKDPEGLRAALRHFRVKAEVKLDRLQLVLDSDLIQVKEMQVPPLNRKKLLALIDKQFAVREAGLGELVHDYMPLSDEAGAHRVLACAVAKEMVVQYREFFGAMGAKLLNIDVGGACAIRAIRRMPELKGKTFIFARGDGADMSAILFENGSYRFSNRSKLQEKRGTSAAAVEIARHLSSMVQFQRAQKAEEHITNTYLCGLEGEEEAFFQDMSLLLNMEVGLLPDSMVVECRRPSEDGLRYSDCLYCFGDLMEDKRGQRG